MSAEKRTNELARWETKPHTINFQEEEHTFPGETWIVTRLDANDYYRREYGHEYQLERRNSINQGWVCGTLSRDDLAGLISIFQSIRYSDEIGVDKLP